MQARRSTNAAALSRLIGTAYLDIKCGLKTASWFAGGREVKRRRVETCIRRYEQPESFKLKQLGVLAERSEVAVFALRHHTRYDCEPGWLGLLHEMFGRKRSLREDQWQRRSKHTELES